VIEDYERVGGEQRAIATLGLPENILRGEGLTRCAAFFVLRPGRGSRIVS